MVAPPLPAPMAAPLPPPAAETTTYVVVKGDTLERIAKKSGVTLKALAAANPGVVPTRLQVGQKLIIPAPASTPPPDMGTAAPGTSMGGGEEMYTVKAGDTLTKIARAHGTTVKAIEAANNLSTTRIKVGQKLKMPSAAPTPAPAVPMSEPAPPGGQ